MASTLGKLLAGLGVGVLTGAGLHVALADYNADWFVKVRGTIEDYHHSITNVRLSDSGTAFQQYLDETVHKYEVYKEAGKDRWNGWVREAYHAAVAAKRSEALSLGSVVRTVESGVKKLSDLSSPNK